MYIESYSWIFPPRPLQASNFRLQLVLRQSLPRCGTSTGVIPVGARGSLLLLILLLLVLAILVRLWLLLPSLEALFSRGRRLVLPRHILCASIVRRGGQVCCSFGSKSTIAGGELFLVIYTFIALLAGLGSVW